MGCDRKFNVHYGWEGGEISPTFSPSGRGEISLGGEISPHLALWGGGEIPPGGGFPSPLKIFLRKVRELFLHALHMNLTLTQHFFTHISWI